MPRSNCVWWPNGFSDTFSVPLDADPGLKFWKKVCVPQSGFGSTPKPKKTMFFCDGYTVPLYNPLYKKQIPFRRVAQLVSASCATRFGELRNSFRRVAQLVPASCATRFGETQLRHSYTVTDLYEFNVKMYFSNRVESNVKRGGCSLESLRGPFTLPRIWPKISYP